MRIAIHVTERVMFTWPSSYWAELIRKVTKSGHEVYVFSDDTNLSWDLKNDKVYNLIGLSEKEERDGMEACEVYVGPPLKYYDMAKSFGIRTIALLGATLNGEGVKTSNVCGGCLDKLDNKVDCTFGDEFCYYEITPNDVLEVL